MKIYNTKVVKRAFQRIADLVTPTMGAKGRMAIIEQEADRPLMTDDGVTVAAEARRFEGVDAVPALSMIEAARNTEREAFDGTTLTVLLTNEFYKAGLSWKRLHPQARADRLEELVEKIRYILKQVYRLNTTPAFVRDIATISSKIPAIGKIVYEAYRSAGNDMNVIVEMDRESPVSSVEHVDGMVIESGYMGEVMRAFTNDPKQTKTTFANATLVFLSQGIFTPTNVREFFNSIPADRITEPFVFFIDKAFDPQSLALLTQVLSNNRFVYQMVFINEEKPEELLLDIAAYTGGQIQDSMLNTSHYLYEHCGHAGQIIIEREKTTILGVEGWTNPTAIAARIESYQTEQEKQKYQMTPSRSVTITRRLSALTSGLTKIKIVSSTITEFNTIRYKLDDAIGAVRCALRDGALPGAGLPLYRISFDVPLLKKALQSPMRTIISNAGLRFPKYLAKHKTMVLDVKRNVVCNPSDAGIIDSFTAVDASLRNAASIASSYLRAFTIIKVK